MVALRLSKRRIAARWRQFRHSCRLCADGDAGGTAMYIGMSDEPREVLVSPTYATRHDRRASEDGVALKISSLFDTSASNVDNAAMQAANVPWDTPVEIRLGADGPGEIGAYVEVSDPCGFATRIPIDEGRLSECRHEEGGPVGIALCQRLVDDLAAQIRTAVKEAVRG